MREPETGFLRTIVRHQEGGAGRGCRRTTARAKARQRRCICWLALATMRAKAVAAAEA